MNHVQGEHTNRVPYTLHDVVDTLELARLERGRVVLAARARASYRAKLILPVMAGAVPIAGFVCVAVGNSWPALYVGLRASVPLGIGVFLVMGEAAPPGSRRPRFAGTRCSREAVDGRRGATRRERRTATGFTRGRSDDPGASAPRSEPEPG